MLTNSEIFPNYNMGPGKSYNNRCSTIRTIPLWKSIVH
uniref:Uncharacterized protein n=1 Tax=Arundo donax TaxID=35708 RepID=A0A0A9ACH8_ARUDO